MSGRHLAVRAAAVAGALAAAVFAAPAAAYRRSPALGTGHPLYWPVPVVPYHVSDVPAAHAPSCTAAGGVDPALEAARAGFAAWRQDCSDLDLVYAGRIAEIRAGGEGSHENLVVFRRGWCTNDPEASACIEAGGEDCDNTFNCFDDAAPRMDRSIVALTKVLHDPETGRIVDADIEVNGWDGLDGDLTRPGPPPNGWYFTCDTQAGRTVCTRYGEAGCNYVDLQNTLTHEVGHFLGLAHPCEMNGGGGVPACASSSDFAVTTMYPHTTPGDLSKRSLSADDVAGLCDIYPTGGGCACGSAGGPGALALLLAALALGPRLRRPRSRRTPPPGRCPR